MEAEYPLHGLVTGVQLRVREEPNPDSEVIGWLRIGSRVRLGTDRRTTATCATGWHPVRPHGWACAGEGIELGETAPESNTAVPPPDRTAPLPYDYYFVKDPLVPEYVQLPPRDGQRAAAAFAERYRELGERDDGRAARLLAGELAGEPARPAVLARLLERGFYVAATGVETRASRRFVRTVAGRYVQAAQLLPRAAPDFAGVELGAERQLPVAWAVRGARPMVPRPRADGTIRWLEDPETEPIERLAVIDGWRERTNVGGWLVHRLEGDRYLKDWFAAVAERIDRPRGVGADEPWVHVDLSAQTLVLYQGDTPSYATLVSTGVEGHETPVGTFQIRRKYVSDTMSSIGPEAADDRYRIEDVPWTQYFDGSVALHGAFWHERFGLTRSHGCVNMSPKDAHRIFNETWPAVPDGWLGLANENTGHRASHVVITP